MELTHDSVEYRGDGPLASGRSIDQTATAEKVSTP
jgi:hypothetical protein